MEVYILVELYQCFEEEGKSSHQIVTTKVCSEQLLFNNIRMRLELVNFRCILMFSLKDV